MKKKIQRLNNPLSSYRTVSVQKMHEKVKQQEVQAAELVGGRAHGGSGASMYCKSDASSDVWQVECKQTGKLSLSIKTEWLKKIEREAEAKSKWPMMHFRFEEMPTDWIMVPRWVFEKLEVK